MLTSIQLVLGVMGPGSWKGDGMTSGWFIDEECGSWPLPLLPDAILKSFLYPIHSAGKPFLYPDLSPFLAFLCSSLPVDDKVEITWWRVYGEWHRESAIGGKSDWQLQQGSRTLLFLPSYKPNHLAFWENNLLFRRHNSPILRVLRHRPSKFSRKSRLKWLTPRVTPGPAPAVHTRTWDVRCNAAPAQEAVSPGAFAERPKARWGGVCVPCHQRSVQRLWVSVPG